MSIKPILFNTDMVRAITDSRKTVTRRVIKPQPSGRPFLMPEGSCWPGYFKIEGTDRVIKPPYQPGDILWVRETWWQSQDGKFHYLADYELPELVRKQLSNECKARPSIHMPKEAARIFLRVKDVRVERLQDITEDGVFQEGAAALVRCDREYIDCYSHGAPEPCWISDPCADCPNYISYPELFGELVWNETVKPADLPLYGWAANPWVWVIEFARCEKPEEWRT